MNCLLGFIKTHDTHYPATQSTIYTLLINIRFSHLYNCYQHPISHLYLNDQHPISHLHPSDQHPISRLYPSNQHPNATVDNCGVSRGGLDPILSPTHQTACYP